jgi:hypothetical protein
VQDVDVPGEVPEPQGNNIPKPNNNPHLVYHNIAYSHRLLTIRYYKDCTRKNFHNPWGIILIKENAQKI